MGPVQWHIGNCGYTQEKKTVLQLSSKLHLTSQLPTFLFQRKNIYIENNTTYNQIHFFRSSSFGYTEVKTSAVFKFLSEKTTSDSPKVSRSS